MVNRMRRWAGWGVLAGLWLLVGAALPTSAQEPPPFATNTPLPPEPVISTPSAPINRFVLRPWREDDLLNVLYTHIRQLRPGMTQREQAIELLQYELTRRFPDAPHDPAAREHLLQAALAAPSARIDLRGLMRPHLEYLVNQRASDGQATLLPFEHNGLQIEVIPANLDGNDGQDAVLHVYYPGPNDRLLYNDFVPIVATNNDTYRLLTTPDLPVAPLGMVESLELMGVGDFNSDGLDELAVSLDDGQLNRELRVFGWRGGSLVSLVQPGQSIRYGAIDTWMAGGAALEVQVYREESAAWQCLSEQGVTWQWTANFFRPAADPTGYIFQDTANCLFYDAEPLYAQPIDDALLTISEIAPLAPSEDDYSAQRAGVYRAMLQVFDGDIGSAIATALELESRAEPDSWLAVQAGALIAALGEQGVTPLEICAALINAGPHGACNVDDALTRILEERPLQRDEPIVDQLAALGIVVRDQRTISQVGRADRQAVYFSMAGGHWWAFAPLDPQVYTAEQIDPLPGFEPLTAPIPVLTASQSLYDALLVDNNPARVLTLLAELRRNNPQTALASDVLYLEALSYDLLVDRTRARQAYYDLWQQSPFSVWGQLAAEHLEQR